jgi:hypothetical protein
LLVPVAVFIAMVTPDRAARREERLAAVRLVGATGGQIKTRLHIANQLPW